MTPSGPPRPLTAAPYDRLPSAAALAFGSICHSVGQLFQITSMTPLGQSHNRFERPQEGTFTACLPRRAPQTLRRMWKLDKQVLELRFKDCYMYWDRTGEITMRHLAAVPSFQVVKADPGQVLLRSVAEGLHARFSYELASLVHDNNESPDTNFAGRASSFVDTTLRLAEVRTLTRIGNRFTYHRRYSTEQDASSAMDALNAKLSLGGKFLDGWTDPRISKKRAKSFEFRLEDAHMGYRFQITTGEVEAVNESKKYFLAADIDIYTVAPTSIDTLHVSELTTQNRQWVETHFISRLS